MKVLWINSGVIFAVALKLLVPLLRCNRVVEYLVHHFGSTSGAQSCGAGCVFGSRRGGDCGWMLSGYLFGQWRALSDIGEFLLIDFEGA